MTVKYARAVISGLAPVQESRKTKATISPDCARGRSIAQGGRGRKAPLKYEPDTHRSSIQFL